MPPGTVGFRASGEVTRDDFRTVLEPALTETRKAGPIHMLHLLEDGFHMDGGALHRDAASGLALGIGHDEGWSRWAIVTDVEWVRMAIHLVEFFIPGELRLFKAGELDEAKAWVAEPSPTEASRGLL
ncbi:MAG TPA: STAS/SEC14 domain-containing protein [Solirubrobacterales bacterium]|nr:STAS/SEC14 domain-containing protein [Solirubrobacterales bacterium]